MILVAVKYLRVNVFLFSQGVSHVFRWQNSTVQVFVVLGLNLDIFYTNPSHYYI